MRDRQIVLRLSASQLERLKTYQARICAPTLSAAIRSACELAMTDTQPPTVGPEGLPQLTKRGT